MSLVRFHHFRPSRSKLSSETCPRNIVRILSVSGQLKYRANPVFMARAMKETKVDFHSSNGDKLVGILTEASPTEVRIHNIVLRIA